MAAPAKPMRFDELPGEAQSDAPPKFDELPGEAQDESPGLVDELTGAFKANALGNLHGASFGFEDETANKLAGADAGAKLKHEVDAAREEHPVPFTLGEIGGGLLAPAAAPFEGALGAIAGGALQGGLAGAGNSGAKTAGGVAKDALKSAAFGGALTTAGEGIGGILDAVHGAIGEAAGANRQAAEDLVLKNASKDYREAVASSGGKGSALMKLYDRATEMLSDPAASMDQRRWAFDWLNSEDGIAAKQAANANVMERAPQALNDLMKAKAVAEDLKQKMAPQAVQQGADELMQSPIRKYVAPRVAKYAQRAIPAYVANKIGGGPAGVAAAGVVGAAIGHPGTALGNIVRHPAVRAIALNAADALIPSGIAPRAAAAALPKLPALQKLLSRPEKLGPFAGPLMNAKTPHEQATAAYVLQSQNPSFRKLLEETEQEPDEDQ